MSDISVTATSVAPGSGCVTDSGIAGATITAGQTLYLDSVTSTIKLADVDASDAASTVIGISLHAATSGQPIVYARAGLVTFNAVLVASKIYIATVTAGGIALAADHTTAWRMSILGVALSTTSLKLHLYNSLTVP